MRRAAGDVDVMSALPEKLQPQWLHGPIHTVQFNHWLSCKYRGLEFSRSIDWSGRGSSSKGCYDWISFSLGSSINSQHPWGSTLPPQPSPPSQPHPSATGAEGLKNMSVHGEQWIKSKDKTSDVFLLCLFAVWPQHTLNIHHPTAAYVQARSLNGENRNSFWQVQRKWLHV